MTSASRPSEVRNASIRSHYSLFRSRPRGLRTPLRRTPAVTRCQFCRGDQQADRDPCRVNIWPSYGHVLFPAPRRSAGFHFARIHRVRIALWLAPVFGQLPPSLVRIARRSQAGDRGAGARAALFASTAGSTRKPGSRATPITDFVQKEPTEGAAADRCDGGALRLRRQRALRRRADVHAQRAGDPGAARPPRQRRLRPSTSWSRSTPFSTAGPPTMFGVTASGVRLDRFHPSDNEDERRRRLRSGLGGARPTSAPTGWTAELWIPFSQLRFNPQRDQVWGAEHPPLPSDARRRGLLGARAAHRARLRRRASAICAGSRGVRPTRRIELLPYVARRVHRERHRDPRNPFDDGRI